MRKNIHLIAFTLLLLMNFNSFSQSINEQLSSIKTQYEKILHEKDSVAAIIEDLKLQRIIERLHELGLPELHEGDDLICHSALCMVFSQEYRLAKWVSHILTGDIIEGRVSRSNDFRPDPRIENTTIETDYFTKTLLDDGKYKYSGYGYDRGHLAPSADFRWSERALSESYYYSNITPQTPEFNREKWAEIESFLRAYIYDNPKNNLFIVTAPVLSDNMPIVERGDNKLSIPQYHYKIAMDYDKKIGIAFLLPQKDLTYPIEWYAVSIDSIESITGINYFSTLSDEEENLIEAQFDISKWQPQNQRLDVSPMKRNELPKDACNTVEAKQFVGSKRNMKVCGKVVSTHKSDKGNVFINLDKSFPNQIFSITIWARDVVNFDFKPEVFLENKRICVTGQIIDYQDIPSMYLKNQRRIEVIND